MRLYALRLVTHCFPRTINSRKLQSTLDYELCSLPFFFVYSLEIQKQKNKSVFWHVLQLYKNSTSQVGSYYHVVKFISKFTTTYQNAFFSYTHTKRYVAGWTYHVLCFCFVFTTISDLTNKSRRWWRSHHVFNFSYDNHDNKWWAIQVILFVYSQSLPFSLTLLLSMVRKYYAVYDSRIYNGWRHFCYSGKA